MLFDADLVALYDGMLDADCDEDCDLDCAVVVSETHRRESFEKFRDVDEARVAQNLYLCKCVELKQRTIDAEDNIIEQTTEFWLGECNIRVCKTFFARTLGLPDARLHALLEPDTFRWYSRYKHLLTGRSVTAVAATTAGGDDDCDADGKTTRHFGTEQPCSEFVLNSR